MRTRESFVGGKLDPDGRETDGKDEEVLLPDGMHWYGATLRAKMSRKDLGRAEGRTSKSSGLSW